MTQPSAPPRHSRTLSTTVDWNDSTGRFQITHPYHPLTGREFGLVTWRRNWSEDRVYFLDDDERLRSLPSQWTSLAPEDPAMAMGVESAHFRLAELLELATLLREQA